MALLRAESDEWSDTYCTVYNPSWGHVPITHHPTSKVCGNCTLLALNLSILPLCLLPVSCN